MFPLPLRQDSKRELWMLELAWRPSRLTWHLMGHRFGGATGRDLGSRGRRLECKSVLAGSQGRPQLAHRMVIAKDSLL